MTMTDHTASTLPDTLSPPRIGPSLAFAVLFYGAQACNYLHLVVAAAITSAADYGAVGAMMGAAYISAAAATGFQLYAAAAQRGRRNTRSLALSPLGLATAVGIAAGGACLASGPFIARALALSASQVAVMALAIALAQPVGAMYGLLQGNGQLLRLGTIQAAAAATRLGAAVALAAAGLGATGIGAGVPAGYVAALAASALADWPRSRPVSPPVRMSRPVSIPGSLGMAMMATACAATPTALDMLLARHYFPDDASGVYATALLAVRLGIFLSLPLPHALVPRLVGGNLRRRQASLLIGAATSAAALVGASGAAFALAGASLLGWPRQLADLPHSLLPWAALASGGASSVSCCAYLWAARGGCRMEIALLALSPVAVAAGAASAHGSPAEMLRAVAVALGAAAMVMCWHEWRHGRSAIPALRK